MTELELEKNVAQKPKVKLPEPLNWQGRTFMVSDLTQPIYEDLAEISIKIDQLIRFLKEKEANG